MAQMPKKETGTSFVGGSDLVVFKNSDNKEAAWEFVEYLSQPEVQQKWYETVSDLPSVQSAWDSGTLATDDKLGLFGEQLKDAKTPPVDPALGAGRRGRRQHRAGEGDDRRLLGRGGGEGNAGEGELDRDRVSAEATRADQAVPRPPPGRASRRI